MSIKATVLLTASAFFLQSNRKINLICQYFDRHITIFPFHMANDDRKRGSSKRGQGGAGCYY